MTEPLESSVAPDVSAPAAERAAEVPIAPIAGEANEDRPHAQDESPALEGPPGQVFHEIPGLVAGEVRRIFVNGDLIPDPGPEEARRMRYEWGKPRLAPAVSPA